MRRCPTCQGEVLSDGMATTASMCKGELPAMTCQECERRSHALQGAIDFILKICYEDGYSTAEIEGWREMVNIRAALAPTAPAAPEPERRVYLAAKYSRSEPAPEPQPKEPK